MDIIGPLYNHNHIPTSGHRSRLIWGKATFLCIVQYTKSRQPKTKMAIAKIFHNGKEGTVIGPMQLTVS